MADVGRQPGDRALEVVAALGVAPCVHAPELLFGCLTPTADWAELPSSLRKLLRYQGIQRIA